MPKVQYENHRSFVRAGASGASLTSTCVCLSHVEPCHCWTECICAAIATPASFPGRIWAHRLPAELGHDVPHSSQ